MMDTILMFSGGIDSTYCAYKYLKENPDKTLLLYHINQKNWEGREPYERKAVEDITNYFKANGLNNFELIYSSVDYGDVTHINYDIVLLAIFTGTILRVPKYQCIKNIITTTCKEESGNGNPHPTQRDRHRRKQEITKLAAYREDLTWTNPNITKSKEDMINEMPAELAKMCWYCRHPKPDGTPCGECHTCCFVLKKPYVKKQKKTTN